MAQALTFLKPTDSVVFK